MPARGSSNPISNSATTKLRLRRTCDKSQLNFVQPVINTSCSYQIILNIENCRYNSRIKTENCTVTVRHASLAVLSVDLILKHKEDFTRTSAKFHYLG